MRARTTLLLAALVLGVLIDPAARADRKPLKTAADFKLSATKKIAGLTTNVNNIHAIGLPRAAGLLAAGPFA